MDWCFHDDHDDHDDGALHTTRPTYRPVGDAQMANIGAYSSEATRVATVSSARPMFSPPARDHTVGKGGIRSRAVHKGQPAAGTSGRSSTSLDTLSSAEQVKLALAAYWAGYGSGREYESDENEVDEDESDEDEPLAAVHVASRRLPSAASTSCPPPASFHRPSRPVFSTAEEHVRLVAKAVSPPPQRAASEVQPAPSNRPVGRERSVTPTPLRSTGARTVTVAPAICSRVASPADAGPSELPTKVKAVAGRGTKRAAPVDELSAVGSASAPRAPKKAKVEPEGEMQRQQSGGLPPVDNDCLRPIKYRVRRPDADNGLYRCRIGDCTGAMDSSKLSIAGHLRAFHPLLKGKIQCPWEDDLGCHKSAAVGNMARHIETVHIRAYLYKCPMDGCIGKRQTRKDAAVRHIRMVHKGRVASSSLNADEEDDEEDEVDFDDFLD